MTTIARKAMAAVTMNTMMRKERLMLMKKEKKKKTKTKIPTSSRKMEMMTVYLTWREKRKRAAFLTKKIAIVKSKITWMTSRTMSLSEMV